MYSPPAGCAASVMPPDCAAIPPSGRTSAHRAPAPDDPAGPAGPGGPVGPAGPGGPVAPRGSWPALKSRASRLRSLTCTEVTLLRGSACTAAYPVPPSTTRSAKHAIIIDGDGNNRLNHFIPSPHWVVSALFPENLGGHPLEPCKGRKLRQLPAFSA